MCRSHPLALEVEGAFQSSAFKTRSNVNFFNYINLMLLSGVAFSLRT